MVHLQAIASHLVISLRFDLEVKGHMGQVKGHMGHMGPSQIRVSKQRQVGSRQRQVASFKLFPDNNCLTRNFQNNLVVFFVKFCKNQ